MAINAILLAEITPLQVAALVFIGVVIFMLLLRTNRHLRDARRPGLLPSVQAKRQAAAATTGRAQVTPELQRWEVQMHDLARELSGRLDSKLSALEHLVNLADARIVELQALLEKLDSHMPASSVGTQAERLAQSATADMADDTTAKKHTSRQAEIYALADAGQTSQAIAAIVGTPVGEVELMLGLRQPR